ncbi:hypothetical protein QEJ31_01580 [Pigmentibacter sp. JX0631]|uniref:hypothetical protein n=1 Tax=Pigmentibacter sp. JX0631 TaxID=2976982 RepID=UPI0024699BB9|nr:hypothetical protein [Pigmentibacter sp. JX0631]WGL60292.1 hypothetical protein QEJ31_01580 [Pigmentibacter sp. JX0631]
MKKSHEKKYPYVILFFLLFLSSLYIFRNAIYYFLIKQNIFIETIQNLSVDEFIEKNQFNKNMFLLNITNLQEDKYIFDHFKYNKHFKKQEINVELMKDNSINSIEKTNSLQKKIIYSLSNNKKELIETTSIILLPNESISCECYDLIKSKTLVFENKGIAANKNETPSHVILTFENNGKLQFEINNNNYTEIKIPDNFNAKLLTISWTKNSSGALIFHGIKKNNPNKKSVFITFRYKKLSDKFFNEIKNIYQSSNLFLNRNSFPLSTNYKENILSLEANNSFINNGFTYKSNDIFNENFKYLFKIINSNYKSLLKINISENPSEKLNESNANQYISINRKRSFSNISDSLSQIINNTTQDFISINIENESFSEENLLNTLKSIDKNTNVFFLNSYDFTFNSDQLKSNFSIIAALSNSVNKLFLNSLSSIKEDSPVSQNLLINLIISYIKGTEVFNYKESQTIVFHSPNEEYFLFKNNYYFTNEKFFIPLTYFPDYIKKIDEERDKYQLQDLAFSFYNFKTIKFKISTKDKIARCFSDYNIKIWQIYFDSKSESYVADLKVQSESAISKLQVNCLLYSEHFANNFQLEFFKDNKNLDQLQLRVGEFLLRPNPNFITNNLFTINNSSDFYLLKSYENHANDHISNDFDLKIISHFFPKIPDNLQYFISYKEKK